MKTSTILFAPILLASGALAVSISDCGGDVFDNYCCANGHFSGPVYSSFKQSVSNRESSQSASFSSRDSSRSASESSREASFSSSMATMAMDSRDAMITPRAVLAARAITTEATPGLTCIGDSLSTIDNNGVNSGSDSSSISTAASAASGSSTSSNFAPKVTQAPVLVAGAAMAFAYGAM